MAARRYDAEGCAQWIAAARGGAGESPTERIFAVAALENLLLRFPPHDGREVEILGALHLMGASGRVRGGVRREGFTSREPEAFFEQLRRLMSANRWAHGGVGGAETRTADLEAFFELVRQPCRLWLSRYLFSPSEVVEWILAQVRRSKGIPSPFLRDETQGGAAARLLFDRLPAYESEILTGLIARGEIFWVARETRSDLFSLVRYPPGTVVLTVRPPGSTLEIEIKRAGRRRDQPLDVVYRRSRGTVPPSHRLDGGSMGLALNWEANASAKFASLYREVHDEEAPLSTTASVQTIFEVPTADGVRHIHGYFEDPAVFGDAYGEMREALSKAWRAFEREREWNRPEVSDETALTHEFLVHTKPAQSILAGSSDLRVEIAARYLSEGGSRTYFDDDLGRRPARHEERLLVDILLAEILPGFVRPPGRGLSFDDYLAAALGLAENRRRADEVYLELMRQAARVWGTLLGVRGCSKGESFVARNVGLRRVWREAAWRVELVFMDHDELCLPPWEQTSFTPSSVLGRMESDDYFLGGLGGGRVCEYSLFLLLGRIYGVSPERLAEGRSVFRAALDAAYRRTVERLTTRRKFADLFHPDLLARLTDWDRIASLYLTQREDGWRESAGNYLSKRKYEEEEVRQHLDAIETHADFIERSAFLYDRVG